MDDLTGKRFGRLTVIEPAYPQRYFLNGKPRQIVHWRCRCDCGKEIVVNRYDLGSTHSCGCLRREKSAENFRKYGARRKPEIFISFDGRTHTVKEWSEITGLSINTIYARIREGRTAREVLRPVRGDDGKQHSGLLEE